MRACILSVLALLAAAIGAPRASAVVDSELLYEFGSLGTAAGQFSGRISIAPNRTTGHVYIAEGGLGPNAGNARISEFDSWGRFVKAWGWGVANGEPELQVCTSTCQAGSFGSGPGQMRGPNGIATDSAANVYVFERHNLRVQKFDSAGNFLLMIGGGVDQGPNHPGNLCTAAYIAEGDTCGAGSQGGAPGQFGVENISGVGGSYIGVGPGDVLYVGDKDRIQEFEPDGTYKGEIPLPQPGNPGALAVDPISGSVYFAFSHPISATIVNPNVYKLSPTGSILATLAVPAPEGVVTDFTGHVYVADAVTDGVGSQQSHVLEFDSSGKELGSCCASTLVDERWYRVPALGTNTANDLYVPYTWDGVNTYIQVYGPAPEFEPPPLESPEISEQYATSVSAESGTVQAKINPRFWSDTRYYVEYGAGKCSEGGCNSQQPLAPGAELTSSVVKAPITTSGVTLAGLLPETTYHYRFVAQSTGSGGEPVRGVGGEVGVDGSEATFTTFPSPAPKSTGCANQAFRKGPGASLPDCRAYEMITPIDKNGAEILTLPDISGIPNTLVQSAADAGSVAYSSYGAFANPDGAPFVAQYLARRGAAGWSSASLVPPRGKSFYSTNTSLRNEVKAFSADLSSNWLRHDSEPQLAAGAVTGYANLYRRNNATDAYEALCPVEPPHQDSASFKPEIQGVSADGSHVVFRAEDNLSPEAPVSAGANQLYDCSGGSLKLVSILPNGTPIAGSSSAGSGENIPNVTNAISADGSRIFWSDQGNDQGKIYARINGSSTVAVSSPESTQPAQFWTAATDGSKAIFSFTAGAKAGNLYLFGVDAKTSTLIAQESLGVLGASDDASYVYFVSRKALDGGATAGQPNLYVFHAGTSTYIATLSATDVDTTGGNDLSPVNPVAISHTARVAPDGRHLAFTSTASLTGRDNLDAQSGKPDAQVFLYAAEGDQLSCLSCNRSGARPSGGSVGAPENGVVLSVAAMIPGAQTPFHGANVLADDGGRVFFTSFDPLVLADVNGAADVYQWEAPGKGGCSVAAPSYSPLNAGCVDLISTGTDPSDASLLDASSSGDDVFFGTAAGLVGTDRGQVDIYDARAGGGFPEPPPPSSPCEGEACLSPGVPPAESTPASSTFHGPGNVKEKPRPRCSKGKHRVKKNGKVRCVKNHKKAKKSGRGHRGARR